MEAAHEIGCGRSPAPVAQLDRASDYESEGRTFESFRARQHLSPQIADLLLQRFYCLCAAIYEWRFAMRAAPFRLRPARARHAPPDDWQEKSTCYGACASARLSSLGRLSDRVSRDPPPNFVARFVR